MSITRQMDKEVVVHICNGILLSYKKECIWVSSSEANEPRVYYTEWSKSERERKASCINAYIWNLERWYYQSYVQDSKGDTDVKDRLLDTVGEGKGGVMWENNIENIYISICKTDGQWEFGVWHGELKAYGLTTWRAGVGRKVDGRRGPRVPFKRHIHFGVSLYSGRTHCAFWGQIKDNRSGDLKFTANWKVPNARISASGHWAHVVWFSLCSSKQTPSA